MKQRLFGSRSENVRVVGTLATQPEATIGVFRPPKFRRGFLDLGKFGQIATNFWWRFAQISPNPKSNFSTFPNPRPPPKKIHFSKIHRLLRLIANITGPAPPTTSYLPTNVLLRRRRHRFICLGLRDRCRPESARVRNLPKPNGSTNPLIHRCDKSGVQTYPFMH